MIRHLANLKCLSSKLRLFHLKVKVNGSQIATLNRWTIIDWRSRYGLAFLRTRESKLRTFQFKFLHRRIATNSHLFKVGITSDNLCSFCKEHSETMMHLFWECTFVQAFWNGIKQWMSKRPCFPNYVFFFQSCLGFVDNASNILSHHFLLICRYHIHWSKLMRLFPSPAHSSLRCGENNIGKFKITFFNLFGKFI